jgi:outer membrane protein OmpA-like peptidoglycan-associated protein
MWAAPVVSGGQGLARILDARNEGLYGWTVGLSFAGDQHGAEHMNDLNIVTWNNSALRAFGSWVPFEPLEVIGSVGLGYFYPVQIPGTSPTIGPWDVELGAKYTWPLEFWAVGADARFFLPTMAPAFGGPRFGGALRLIASTEIDIVSVHLNLGGKFIDQPEALLGVGVEVLYEFLNPYLELTAEVTPDAAPLRLTPGLRIVTNPGISFFYAGDFGLNRAARSVDIDNEYYVNQSSFGVAYSPASKVEVVKRKANFHIKVTDASTDLPVAAQVSISDHYPGSFMLGSSGERVLEVESGRYQVTVSAPGYASQTFGIRFSPRRTASVDVALDRGAGEAYLAIRVIDHGTNQPVPSAVVSINGMSQTTPVSGDVNFNLEPGTYDVLVSAAGYRQASEKVIVSRDIPLALNISMLSEETRISLSGINFATASAEILPSSYPSIDEAARFLEGNPDLRVEIQGHTDSQGSASANLSLSQRRAEAVRNYLVNVHGVPPWRLVAQGYGESSPVASNDTEAGRAANRRVEMVVLP